jgi:hypothetical protein
VSDKIAEVNALGGLQVTPCSIMLVSEPPVNQGSVLISVTWLLLCPCSQAWQAQGPQGCACGHGG